MESKVIEAVIFCVLMLVMFTPLFKMLWEDKSKQFIRIDLPDVDEKDLPRTFQDVDRRR